jgi:short-subunit dehydrogenase
LKPAIIVTGAASGIGREFARVAAREGLSLVLIDRAREPLESLASEIRHRHVDAHTIVIDLGSPEAGETIEHMIAARGLYCEVLVNNAGLSFVGPVLVSSIARQLELVDVNVKVLTELSLRFLPAMVQRRCGGILNVGSVGAYIPGPNMAVYNASKAYVSALSAALASHVAQAGVSVACLVIGKVRTAMWTPAVKPRAWMERLPQSSAREVAEAGWREFRRGKTLIIPQRFYRLATYALRIIPARCYACLSSGWFGPIPDSGSPADHLRPAIVVTGASSGIGRALATHASRKEGEIVLITSSTEALEPLAGELAAGGASVHVLATDLTRPGVGKEIEKALAKRHLYCDVLINGGSVQLAGETHKFGLGRQMQLLAVNVRALTELTLHFLPGMAARRRGGVLTVVLGAGIALPEMAVHCASTAYATSLSEALSCEMRSKCATVTCLRPGRMHRRTTGSVDRIAEAALRGFRAGKPMVFVDWRHRALVWLSRLSPVKLFRN